MAHSALPGVERGGIWPILPSLGGGNEGIYPYMLPWVGRRGIPPLYASQDPVCRCTPSRPAPCRAHGVHYEHRVYTARVAKCALLTRRLTGGGTVLKDLSKGSKRAESGEKGGLHGAIP